ncbi:MAG TPA: heavy metal-responsive transcriptional regulator [Gammaproteobacteria bacterium]|nr:heavy metal-responsive transcriptional regulator [Gammaproteobacteria bacterium]
MAYLIGETANALGLSADTLRYYEKIGLVPRAAKNRSGHRVFSDKDLSRLRFVQRAQSIGFSLEEIRRLLKLRENPAKCSRVVRKLAREKCDHMQDQLQTLKKMHDELSLLLNLCTSDAEHCPILDRLDSSSPGWPGALQILAVSKAARRGGRERQKNFQSEAEHD